MDIRNFQCYFKCNLLYMIFPDKSIIIVNMIKKHGAFLLSMLFKIILPLAFWLFVATLPVFTQEPTGEYSTVQREDFWICPGAEIAMFSVSNASFGGALSLGYGRRAAIGLKAAWLIDGRDRVSTLEFNFLLRWFFLDASWGPYIQFNGGPAFFIQDEGLTMPAKLGTISAGISAGWRFLLGRFWFAEAAIRGGYPYIAGGGISFGLHL